MRVLCAALFLFVLVDASLVDNLNEMVQELLSPLIDLAGVTRVRPSRRFREEDLDDVEEHDRRRQAIVCGGVGTRVPTENVCLAQNCTVVAFNCPGVSGTTPTPTNFSSCSVASMRCTGSLGGATTVTPPANCFVSRMSCPAERYEWLTSATPCFVQQLDCPVNLTAYVTPERCVRATLTCSGNVTFNDTTVPRTSDPCVVARRDCTGNETCEDWVRLCDQSSTCLWKRKPCSSGCIVPNTKNVCTCPVDYLAPTCTRKRSSLCFFTLVAPAKRCERVDPNDQSSVDADPVCHRYRTSDTVDFRYRLNCSFADKPANMSSLAGGFPYSIFNSSALWAVSSARSTDWVAQCKVFNWRSISDLSVAPIVNLSVAQLTGNEDIVFSLNFARLNASAHLYGGRCYAEVGFTLETVALNNVSDRSFRDRLFVDFVNLADLSLYPEAGQPARAAVLSPDENEESRGRSFFIPLVVAACVGLASIVFFALK